MRLYGAYLGEPDASGSPFCLYSNRPLKMTVFDDPRQKIRTKPLQTCQPLSANYFFNCEGDTFIGIFHFMKSKDSRERLVTEKSFFSKRSKGCKMALCLIAKVII